jgi:hypothetical protein
MKRLCKFLIMTLLLFLLILYSLEFNKQLVYAEGFIKTYRNIYFGGSVTEAMVITPNDDIVVAGSYDSHGHVTKIDALGNLIWHKRYNYGPHYFKDIELTPDNGFIIAGYRSSSENGDEAVLIKIDNEGNVSWEKSFGGTEMDRLHSVFVTSDNGFIAAGESTSFFGTDGAYPWAVKFDSNGNILWEKLLVMTEADPYEIFETDDGYIVGGGFSDYWFAKLDFTGNVIWGKKVGRNNDDKAFSIIPTENGFIAAGTGFRFPWIVRFDSLGNVIWQKVYGDWGYAKKIIASSDGNFIFAAEVDTDIQDDENIFIVKINGNGEVIFQKTIGGVYKESLPNIAENSVGDIIISAKERSFCLDDNLSFMVAKVNSGGELGQCDFFYEMNYQMEETYAEVSELSISPNETNSNITEILTIISFQDTFVKDVCPGSVFVDCDNDLVHDSIDNCPFHNNPDQEDTYPPSGNGIGDVCECEGNFDCDWDLDGGDAVKFKVDFGRSTFENPCETGNPCNGDFDCDRDVDGTDAAVFRSDFGRSQYYMPCRICYRDVWCLSYPE